MNDAHRMPTMPLLLWALVLAAVSCTPGPARQEPASTGPAPVSAAGRFAPTRVVIAASAEVNNLGPKLEAGNVYAVDYSFLLDSPLAVVDPEGAVSPLLAAELPSQDNGSWVVNADGTMRTTWKLKPAARWHDGRPVSPSDFVLALKVQQDAAMPQGGRVPERFIDRIEPVDEHSFVIHWRQQYPWANVLVSEQLQPLPEHRVGRLYGAGNPEAFINDSFWTTPEYVGNGPFRIVQWERGSQLTYRAFDDYFMGRPRIDEIIIRIIPDINTTAANVLSGAVDMTLGIALGQRAAATVKGQWATSAEGEVASTPVRLRFAQIQFDPTHNQQTALFDVRVRRALIHGLDRDMIAQVVSEGTSPAGDVPVPPNDPRFAAIDRAIQKYAYDPTRALALLGEAGWIRSAAGGLVNAGGRVFELDLRALQGTDNETEQNAVASDLRKLGLEVTQSLVPQARIRDLEYRINFPGLNTTALGTDVPSNLNLATSDQCPNPSRGYSGINRGCWKNADYDRLYNVATSSLSSTERDQALGQMLHTLTQEVGIIGLDYQSENVAIRRGIVGPGPHWPQSSITWNVHEWTRS